MEREEKIFFKNKHKENQKNICHIVYQEKHWK